MHPTVEEQLAAVRRLLDEVAADPGIGAPSSANLELAARTLRRIERSAWSRLAFLRDDNTSSVRLLAELTDVAPELAAEADAVAPSLSDDEPTAHAVNKTLRALLARAVRELPDDEPSMQWRARLAEHLSMRTRSDPALNRPEATR